MRKKITAPVYSLLILLARALYAKNPINFKLCSPKGTFLFLKCVESFTRLVLMWHQTCSEQRPLQYSKCCSVEPGNNPELCAPV